MIFAVRCDSLKLNYVIKKPTLQGFFWCQYYFTNVFWIDDRGFQLLENARQFAARFGRPIVVFKNSKHNFWLFLTKYLIKSQINGNLMMLAIFQYQLLWLWLSNETSFDGMNFEQLAVWLFEMVGEHEFNFIQYTLSSISMTMIRFQIILIKDTGR